MRQRPARKPTNVRVPIMRIAVLYRGSIRVTIRDLFLKGYSNVGVLIILIRFGGFVIL